MSMITAFTSTTPSTITSIGHRLTACCQLMEIRSQGDPAPWFFLTNEEDPGHHFFKGTFSAFSVWCVCVNASWIVYGNFFYAQHPFFGKIRLFIICLFLGVFTLCVFWELVEWIDWQRPPCMAADGVLYIFPASTSLKNQVKGENETRDEQILHVRDDQCHGTIL